MPGLNQQGPLGQGPMTGRKLGKCVNTDNKQESNEQVLFGRGYENRRGMSGQFIGQGNRNRFRGGR
jgi:hypothetical protein